MLSQFPTLRCGSRGGCGCGGDGNRANDDSGGGGNDDDSGGGGKDDDGDDDGCINLEF